MATDSNDAERQKRARPGCHDPTAGIGGAAPALSALSLRIVLSALGVLFGIGIIVVSLTAFKEMPLLIGGIALTVLAAINLVVVIRRKARGEPG